MTKIIIVLLLLATWSLIIKYHTNKSKKMNEDKMDSFWNTERKANYVRKKDISTLNYIHISLSDLPMNNTSDSQLMQYQDKIVLLSKKEILNLSNKTNTELKMEYGAGNLTFLIQCDSNYTELVRTIYQWGNHLYKLGLIEQAVKVLEYGVKCGTDIAANYTMLACYYKEHGNMTALQELMEKAQALASTRKESIVTALEDYLT